MISNIFIEFIHNVLLNCFWIIIGILWLIIYYLHLFIFKCHNFALSIDIGKKSFSVSWYRFLFIFKKFIFSFKNLFRYKLFNLISLIRLDSQLVNSLWLIRIWLPLQAFKTTTIVIQHSENLIIGWTLIIMIQPLIIRNNLTIILIVLLLSTLIVFTIRTQHLEIDIFDLLHLDSPIHPFQIQILLILYLVTETIATFTPTTIHPFSPEI